MKIGFMLPGLHSVEMSAMALQGANQLGVDSIWMSDHMLGIAHPALWPELPCATVAPDPDGLLDPFCVAAALGGSTGLPMGTCVTDTVRRRGGDLARTALTLNQTCKGGFVLGIGSGEVESTLPFGYTFDRPVGRLEEALQEIRSLFDTGRMPGGLFGRTGLPRGGPNGGPKLWVAAHGPRALRLTGTYADGWLPTASTPQVYTQQYEIVKDAAHRADRPVPTGSLCPLVLFAQSHEQAVAALDEVPLAKLIMLVAPASLWAEHGLEHPHGPDCRGFPDFLPHALDPEELRAVASRIPIEMVEDFVMIGDAHDVAARLKAFGDAGLEHVVLCDLTGLAFPPQVAAANLGQIATLCEIMHDDGPDRR